MILGYRRPGGSTIRFKRTKVGDRSIVTRIDEDLGKWQSAVTMTFASVGDHLLPTKLQFDRIFGKRWGPETVTLKGWKLR